MQRGNGVGGAVLVEETQADAQHDDRRDDRGVRRVARQTRNGGCCQEEQQQWVPQLTHQHRECGNPTDCKRIRPSRLKPPSGFSCAQPVFAAPKPGEDLRNRESCRGREIEAAGCRRDFRPTRMTAIGRPVAGDDNMADPTSG